MDEIFFPRLCFRWSRCSVNKCPLDPLNAQRESVPGDPERTCKEHPRHRLEVVAQAEAAGVNIPGGGLTAKERSRDLDALLVEWDAKGARKEAGGKRLNAYRDREKS